MKRTLILFTFLLIATMSLAQTQQGYVKTLGRPDKAGEPLGGVSVRVKGGHNEVLSGSDGIFEMRMDGKKNGEAYALQSVQKAGYELNENDIIGRQFAFSDKVRLEIVMVSSSLLQAEKRRIENNAYAVAQRNYNAKAESLEKQLHDSAITEQQYREQIADLWDKFEKYQSLIDGMAEHYAHTDYDFLDEKDREINLCIENGELERADSLIRLLFDPIGVLERNKAALADIEQRLGQAQDILVQANEDMAAVLKQQEKDAEYLYQLYTIANLKFETEKAEEYLATRAELDSTNVEWQIHAAVCFHMNNNYKMSEVYFARISRLYQNASNPHEGEWAGYLNDLGVFYNDTKHYPESEATFIEALSIVSDLVQTNPQYYNELQSRIQNNLGSLYSVLNRYSESESYYKESLSIRRKLAKNHDFLSEIDLATTLNDLALIYSLTQQLSESEALYLESLSIYERLVNANPNTFEIDLARTYGNLALLYNDTYRFSESETCYKKALKIQQAMAKNNPRIFIPEVAETLKSIASLYFETGRYEDAETYYLEAIEIQRSLAKDYPKTYEESLSSALCGLAGLYSNTQRYQESEELYKEAIEIQNRLVKDYPDVFSSQLAGTQALLANLYFYTERYDESEPLYKEAINTCRRLVKANPQVYEAGLFMVIQRLGIQYFYTQRLYESEILFLEALELERKMVKTNPYSYEFNLAETLYYLGYIKIQNNDYSAAIQYLKESAGLYKHLGDAGTDFRFTYYEVLGTLSQLHFEMADYSSAYQYNQKMLQSIESLTPSEKLLFQEQYVLTLNNQSFYSLFLKKFKQAETYARETLTIDPTNNLTYTNLAASLLLQGNTDEAITIYQQYKDSLKDGFLDDLQALEAADIIPKERKSDVERIRKMLSE